MHPAYEVHWGYQWQVLECLTTLYVGAGRFYWGGFDTVRWSTVMRDN